MWLGIKWRRKLRGKLNVFYGNCKEVKHKQATFLKIPSRTGSVITDDSNIKHFHKEKEGNHPLFINFKIKYGTGRP